MSRWHLTVRAILGASVLCWGLVAGRADAAAATAVAGVTVTVNNATATIAGSASGDVVTVTWDGVDGAYTVTGGAGTTVNGAASVSVTGVKSFVADMGDGDDALTFDNVPIPKTLSVQMGDGDDTLELVGTTVGGGAKLFGEAGNDTIVVRDQSEIRKTLNLKGGGGDDTITLKASTLHGLVRIIGGPGRDHMTLNGIDMPDGTELSILGHAGNDWLGISQCNLRRPLWVGMGKGSDLVTITDTRCADTVGLVGGGADDYLYFDHNHWMDGYTPRIDGFELD